MKYNIKEFVKGDGTKQYEVKKYWFSKSVFIEPNVEGFFDRKFQINFFV
jgi:hypothetical protein